jgi:hypothetical protein
MPRRSQRPRLLPCGFAWQTGLEILNLTPDRDENMVSGTDGRLVNGGVITNTEIIINMAGVDSLE